jgi:hypothetical protein
MFAEV